MDMKRFFLYAIVIAALMLAGCGGNGGGTPVAPEPPPVDMAALQAQKNAAAAAETAAMVAYEAAKAAVAAVMDDASADMDSYNAAVAAEMAAKTAYEAAKTANTNADAATTVADAMKYANMAKDEQMKAETANGNAMKYADMVTTAANNVSDVTVPTLPTGYASNPVGMFTVAAGASMDNGDVTYSCPAGGAACEIEVMADGTVTSTGGAATAARSSASIAQQITDEETARIAAVAAATKAAGTKEKAIATEAAQTTDAGLGGTARDNADAGADATDDDPYTLEISRDRDGTTIKITDPALADPKFAQAMDLGRGTTMHVRTMEADSDGNVESEVVMVTTDIAAPKATAFGMVAGQTLNANAQGATAAGVAAIGFDPGDELTADTNAAILANIKSDDFIASSGSSNTITFDAAVEDDTTTNDVDETKAAAEVMGYYNGAMGTYRCTGADNCTVTANSKGELSAMSQGWVFYPATGATSDVPDADYLHYGFWLKRTTDSDGVLTYNEVETFAGSSIPASGSVADVTGTATYSGGATGVYVKNVLTSTGTLESATSGHFTATANLTATFGQTVDDPATTVNEEGQIAPNMLDTLTGAISNYQLAHGEDNNWMTVLSGNITDTGTVTGGTAKGGSPANDGSFNATFHGSTDDGDGNATVKPSVVVGEFNSFFTDGSVAGGFGASEDQ